MFRSVDQALRFAFEMQARPILNRCDLSGYVATCLGGRLLGMGKHDLHAQAALIRGMVERLSDATQLYVIAAYGDPESRETALERIAAGLPVAVKSAAARLLVEQYLGIRRPSVEKLRSAIGCRKAKALLIRRCAWDAMDAYHARAMAEIEEYLGSRGLVASHTKKM